MKIYRLPVILLAVATLALGSFAQTSEPNNIDPSKAGQPTAKYQFPSANKRFRRFVNDTVGVGAWIGTGIGATFGQLDNTPPEWKKTSKGFGRRVASNFGINAIEQTSIYGISEALRQDPKYRPSDSKNVGKRIVHALRSGVTATNRSGNTVFSPAKVAAPFIANVSAVKLWYPDRYSVQDGVRRGAYAFGFSFGFNLIEEFILRRK